LENSLCSQGGTKEAKLISEGVGQEWGVCGELKTEGQGLTEVLLNLLLGCKMERAIRSGNLYLRHTMHWLDIF